MVNPRWHMLSVPFLVINYVIMTSLPLVTLKCVKKLHSGSRFPTEFWRLNDEKLPGVERKF